MNPLPYSYSERHRRMASHPLRPTAEKRSINMQQAAKKVNSAHSKSGAICVGPWPSDPLREIHLSCPCQDREIEGLSDEHLEELRRLCRSS